VYEAIWRVNTVIEPRQAELERKLEDGCRRCEKWTEAEFR